MTHTPGPWVVDPLCAQVMGGGLDEDGAPVPIAQVLWPTQYRSEPETFANARLIAAAPDLLEALEGLLSHPGTHHSGCIHWQQVGCDCEFSEVANAARAAIAKATGASA